MAMVKQVKEVDIFDALNPGGINQVSMNNPFQSDATSAIGRRTVGENIGELGAITRKPSRAVL
jgi:hypothetical protein